MPAAVNPEYMAVVLLEAIYSGDDAALKKFGVSLRTLQRWRKQLQSDDGLASFVATKKAELDSRWAESLPAALRNSIEFISEASARSKADPDSYQNPVLVQSIAGAMKLCADVYYTGKIIDARIASINREANGIPESVSAGTETRIN